MSKPNLLDDHRKAWEHLIGQRRIFRGTVSRFGHKRRQGDKIKRGATLVITDVNLFRSPNKIDHVWLDYTPEIAVLGEHIRPNAIIEFEAEVSTYIKGGKNIYCKGEGTFDDIELINIKNVKVIKEPFSPKSYELLIDENLVSYAIRARLNVQQGVILGEDPYGRLGKIRIGQGFCNKLAKKLSWRWINELPEKYGGGLRK